MIRARDGNAWACKAISTGAAGSSLPTLQLSLTARKTRRISKSRRELRLELELGTYRRKGRTLLLLLMESSSKSETLLSAVEVIERQVASIGDYRRKWVWHPGIQVSMCLSGGVDVVVFGGGGGQSQKFPAIKSCAARAVHEKEHMWVVH